MIRLTRLNNQPLMVNSDLIKFVEHAPDTVLTLVTGEKILVSEPAERVLEKIVEFRRSILAGMVVTAAEGKKEPSASASTAPIPGAREAGER